MRTISFAFNCSGDYYRATVTLPDEYFSPEGLPLWHKLNHRFSAPCIIWDRIIGTVPVDQPLPVVNEPTILPIAEELQKLREVVASLEKKSKEIAL